MFYVYRWYIKETNETIYVGKGTNKRYLCKKHNKLFGEFIKRFNCESEILEYFAKEEDAFYKEYELIEFYKSINECVCNIRQGGFGGETSTWTSEKRKHYSTNNVMKSQSQRERMKKNNPMRNKEYAKKNGILHSKPFYIGDSLYRTLEEASIVYKVTPNAILYWLKKGTTPTGEKIIRQSATKH